MPRFISLLILTGALLQLGLGSASGQWSNQVVVLKPGWNAVFLEIQPQPADCDTQFAGLPIESVWAWNRQFSTVQYIQDPNALIPGQPDWLVYVRPTSTDRAVASLHSLAGERAYLIKLSNVGSNVTWNITGQPAVRSAQWLANSFNYVGIHVDAAAPPTFLSYFAGSPAHVGQPIYRLNSSGTWSLANAATDRPNRGEAFWINCAGASSYSGPLAISLEQGQSLDYGRSLAEQTLVIANAATNSRTVSISQLASAAPPGTNYPALAGDVPLSYWVLNYPSNIGFYPLPATLSNTIPPGGRWEVRLAIRRGALAAYTLPPGFTNALYQKLLQVSDGAGTRLLVPTTAQSAMLEAVLGAHPGLWVGAATITNVSQGGSSALTNTASPFQFRLIVHQNTNGQVNLLRQVLVAARTNEPSHYLLITDLRSNTVPYDMAVRQFTSAAFGFYGPLPLSPGTASVDFTQDGTTFNVTNILMYNDPLNPFVHLYHPDHNNLDENRTNLPVTITDPDWQTSQSPGPHTSESFTVTRYISLLFTAIDPEGLAISGWGANQVGGLYYETITGLHKYPLYVQGTFRLHLAADTGWLNAGP